MRSGGRDALGAVDGVPAQQCGQLLGLVGGEGSNITPRSPSLFADGNRRKVVYGTIVQASRHPVDREITSSRSGSIRLPRTGAPLWARTL